MNVGIYSFAQNDLNKEILYYQKEVFRKFNLNINQVIIDKSPGKLKYQNKHGDALNKIIHNATDDYIVIFDVDCIPLNKLFYNTLLSQIKDGNTLSGSIGCALHIDPTIAYIHPCFFGFKKSLYYDCGAPDLKADNHPWPGTTDTAQEFTNCCRKAGKKLKFWNVTDSSDTIWESASLNLKFGHGTIFEDSIYHQYEIRKSTQQEPFIQKCKEVLNDS